MVHRGIIILAPAYGLLMELAPEPERLVMEIEMFPPAEEDKAEARERSLAFMRSLPAV